MIGISGLRKLPGSKSSNKGDSMKMVRLELPFWRYFLGYFLLMFLGMFSFECVLKLHAAGLNISSIIWKPLASAVLVGVGVTFLKWDDAE